MFPTNIFNGECDAIVVMTLNDFYAKVKVIYFGAIDSSYTTSYRLSIVTFALVRTV